MKVKDLFEKFDIDIELNEHMREYELEVPDDYEFEECVYEKRFGAYVFKGKPLRSYFKEHRCVFEVRNLEFFECDFDGEDTHDYSEALLYGGVDETGWIR